MAAPAPLFLSLEQFQAHYGEQKPSFEYWFGEAVPKTVPISLHGVYQAVLTMLLMQKGWKVASEVRLNLSRFAHPIPDLMADAKSLQFPYPMQPFDLCIEIVSKDGRLDQLFGKGSQYLDWGIRHVWIVDPQERNAFSMTLECSVPMLVDGERALVAHALSLPLRDVLAAADQMVA